MHSGPQRRVTLATAPIPFRTTFKHASAARKVAENVIVKIEDEDGFIGLGEGCPRQYVSGETQETALSFLSKRAPSVGATIDSLEELRGWIEDDKDIDANPSAACALELALLDLLARRAGVSVEQYLGHATVLASPEASAVYGDASPLEFLAQFAAFGWNRMRDSKLKVSGNPRRDRWRAALLARRGRLRLDANNLWPDTSSAIAALTRLAQFAWAVEEPLTARAWEGMEEIGEKTGLTIILDESCLCVGDLAAIPPRGNFAVNVRVSKHGGLIRTLAVVQAARARGLKIVVGAQVGETSLLARAGLVAVSAAGDAVIGYEGGYGVHLLQQDLCSPSLTFRRNGAFNQEVMSNLPSPGLGMDLASHTVLISTQN